jgi:probable phosphoglycerate mutase
MELILIRHGEPDWFAGGRGHDDPHLTERGHRQAARLAERARGWSADALWVSPAHRAQETAAPLAEVFGLAPVTYPWLVEARPPSFEGATPEEVEALFRDSRRRTVAHWWSGLLDGEDPKAFVARVADGLDAALGRLGATSPRGGTPPLWADVPRDLRVVIVSHAGTSAAALSHLLGLEQVPWAWERFRLDHAAFGVLRTVAIADGVIFGLASFNDREHHPEDQRTR